MSATTDPGLDYVNPAAAYGFDASYRDASPNWDIGRPQRAFVALAEAGRIGRRVIEVGCGTGELSLFLARRGHEVVGVDVAPTAIRQAREKARWRRVRAHFLVWDALRLDALGVTADTVVDSAMLHCLGPAERRLATEAIRRTLRPDGWYFLVCDARGDDVAPTWASLSRADLRDLFTPERGWELAFVADTVFERRGTRNPAFLVGARRTR
ncbi:class I SAM-dependent methyltransferase [Halobaculum magnesiiphilum]|uniref:Class I SAM-dependent methyltransferase n=1 Tax=Halobaculum magnesiiphilum TaxID=1017351 RepID=A0A8T8WEC9_9EURY|nr:class I SAM-dependent methyltransferase [Halobaculum magnesiiphilum]QZP38210.1 class I SAM-dependent methyltransferase [Halobaculum magnesiiphilum]